MDLGTTNANPALVDRYTANASLMHGVRNDKLPIKK